MAGVSRFDVEQMEREFNPPIIIRTVKYRGHEINIVADDFLVGGTKTRALWPLLKDIPTGTTVVYAGPAMGLGQFALTRVATLLGLKVQLYLIGRPNPMSEASKRLRASIFRVNLSVDTATQRAQEWIDEDPTKRQLIAFGCDIPGYREVLADAIRRAWVDHGTPTRLWLASGSATLLNALYLVFPPETGVRFMVVVVGRKVYPDQIQADRTTIFDYKALYGRSFEQSVVETKLPPYPSVPNYDAKVWHVLTDMIEREEVEAEGNFIWNVGRVPT